MRKKSKTTKRDLETLGEDVEERGADPAGVPDGSAEIPKALGSIRSKILRRIVPILVIPLLLLGAFAMFSIIAIEQRTDAAVVGAEAILTEQVVQDSVVRAAERGSRELNQLTTDWYDRLDRLVRDPEVVNIVTTASGKITEENLRAGANASEIESTLASGLTQDSRELARSASTTLAPFGTEGFLTIVSSEGFVIGSNYESDVLDHEVEDWFFNARRDGYSVSSFVEEAPAPAAFEIVRRIEPMTAQQEPAYIRLRVPLEAVQPVMDAISSDFGVDVAVIDTSSSVLISNTASTSGDSVLYDQAAFEADESGANLDLLTSGLIADDQFLTAGRRAAARPTSPAAYEWLVQASQPLDAARAPLDQVQQASNEIERLRELLTFVAIGILLASLLLGLMAVRRIADRITRPVADLTSQAKSSATVGIPSVVEAAKNSQQELPELADFTVDSNDELSVLATSLNTMQDAAVDLAAGQAKLRRQNVARTFVSLGRRNQNLLNRQLEFIDDLERQESDPDALENLFRLDHLATRMRRNAENLLVLAGEQTPRRWAKPVAVSDILNAAASEIGDYRRVELGDVDRATVSGSAATDLSHLIAELLENAGSFSPPHTKIKILGQRTPSHFRLAIIDEGIGMDQEALEQANQRLANPVDFADAPSAYLGLFVVGHLARQLGMTVRLSAADPSGESKRTGTIAFIDIPAAVLADQEAEPTFVSPAAQRASAQQAAAAASPAPQPLPAATEPPPTAPVADTPPPAEVSPTVAPEPSLTEAGFPKRVAAMGTPPIPDASLTDVSPQDAGLTSAGFPKRTRATEDAATIPQQSAAAPAPDPSRRDAAEVSNSLRSFRAAVARGRQEAAAPAPTAQPVQPLQSAQPAPQPIAQHLPAPPTPPTAPGSLLPEPPAMPPPITGNVPSSLPTTIIDHIEDPS